MNPDYDAFSRVLLITLVPVLTTATLGLAYGIQSCCKPHRKDVYLQVYGWLFLFKAYVLLPTMSVALFGMFECSSFDKGKYLLLDTDLSIDCYTQEHLIFMIYAGVFMFSPVGTSSTSRLDVCHSA